MESYKLLTLKARHQVYTLLSGHNLSKLHGEGYDFSELREYQMGDDIRKINWTITAKLGKPYIKEFNANRELSVVVCALMDGSLYFGKENAKQHKLTQVATLLAYATQQNKDLFTGICYTQHHTYTTPPTKQYYHIEQFSRTLFDASLLGTTLESATATQDLFARIHKPSLLFIIGDFLQEIDLSILAQKHEIIAIIIRDEAEESPSKLGEVTLTNPHNAQTMQSYFGKRSITEYLTQLQAHEAKREAHFARYDIRSLKITTQEEAVIRLLELFR